MKWFEISLSDYVVHLQDAIENGRPALLENVADELDPGLEAVLLKQTFQHNGADCILLGDQVVRIIVKL